MLGHVVRAVNRKPPFAAEVAFVSGLGVGRDDCYKKAAIADPFVNLAVPGIAAPKLAAVEPHLDACGAQRIA